jgi:glycerol-3-phosphate dehydrogenase
MGADWTGTAPLPGGEIPDADYESFANTLREAWPWMPRDLVHHYGRLYGARARDVVKDATRLTDLGRHHGGLLYEAEVRYLVAREWARTPDDILLRRTKHYLHMTEAERNAFAAWFEAERLAEAA